MLEHESNLLKQHFDVLDIVQALDLAEVDAKVGLKAALRDRIGSLFQLLRVSRPQNSTTSGAGVLRRRGTGGVDTVLRLRVFGCRLILGFCVIGLGLHEPLVPDLDSPMDELVCQV